MPNGSELRHYPCGCEVHVVEGKEVREGSYLCGTGPAPECAYGGSLHGKKRSYLEDPEWLR